MPPMMRNAAGAKMMLRRLMKETWASRSGSCAPAAWPLKNWLGMPRVTASYSLALGVAAQTWMLASLMTSKTAWKRCSSLS